MNIRLPRSSYKRNSRYNRLLKEYCKYNDYTEEETRKMIEENSKIEMYNYSSNPVLPDSDFDGRLDNRDGTYDYYNEPVTGNASGIINNAIKTFLFSNPKDKIVSMRLYDKHYDENDSSWWRDKRDSLGIKTEIDYIRDVAKADCIHKGNIVKFNINGDE